MAWLRSLYGLAQATIWPGSGRYMAWLRPLYGLAQARLSVAWPVCRACGSMAASRPRRTRRRARRRTQAHTASQRRPRDTGPVLAPAARGPVAAEGRETSGPGEPVRGTGAGIGTETGACWGPALMGGRRNCECTDPRSYRRL